MGFSIDANKGGLGNGEVDVVECCEGQRGDSPVVGLEVHGAVVAEEVHCVKGVWEVVGIASWAICACVYIIKKKRGGGGEGERGRKGEGGRGK